jgi:SAM-dependent methyltransferase
VEDAADEGGKIGRNTMPTVNDNIKYWSQYPWPQAGDEWSAEWGGTENLWHGTIWPRIHAFLPAKHVLEIAPGYGRCTQYLLGYAEVLSLVDIAENCISACKRRFAAYKHIRYHLASGKSLDMVEDSSVDFVFSWDSLVHCESEVIYVYLSSLAQKMRPHGVGFLHHSNIGAYRNKETGQLSVENKHWRGETMSAELFRGCCKDVGLQPVAQEIIGWGGTVLTDCFSVFINGANSAIETRIYENPDFMREALTLKKISQLYQSVKLP